MTPTDDYDILTARSPEELKTLTKAAIKNGWIAVGPMTYTGGSYASAYRDNNRDYEFMQTIVKASPTLVDINTKLGTIISSLSTISTTLNILNTISTNVSSIKSSTASIDSKTE